MKAGLLTTVPTATRPIPRPGEHLPALDGLRGIAIIVVLCFHSLVLRPDMGTAANLYLKVMSGGWVGVDLFFVLSGFLITGILHDSKGSPQFFRVFYMRRFLRIFPLYYAFFLVALFVLPETFRITPEFSQRQAWCWLYLQNLAPWWDAQFSLPYPLSPTWSLAIEEQFYLVWPFIIFGLSRTVAMKWCAAIIPMALALRCAHLAGGVPEGLIYSTTWCRVDTLAAGAFVALAVRGPGGVASVARRAKPVAILSAIAILVVGIRQRDLMNHGTWLFTFGLTAIALFFASLLAMLLAASQAGLTHRVLTNGFLRSVGRYSYAMYLFHLPVQMHISYHWWTREPILRGEISPLLGQFISHLLLFAVTYGLALASWWCESHILKLKRFFEYRKPAATPRPASMTAAPAP